MLYEAVRDILAMLLSEANEQEAAYKFMYAMAGDFPGFEEASRAFFAKDAERFDQPCWAWAPDDSRKRSTPRTSGCTLPDFRRS